MGGDHRSPLVGREPELAALHEVVGGVRRGGRIAVVEGEAGIGKARLVAAALAAARDTGVGVLTARAEELEARRPSGPIAACIGPERLGEQSGVLDQQFRVAEIVLELLDERGPVVLAVEDLHWADPGTLGVLAHVAAGIERLPAALLVSARPQPRRPELERLLGVLAARGATGVRAGPLDARSCLELVEGLVRARPGPELAAQVDRAGGNPPFVGELVGALLDGGRIVRGGGRAELAAGAAAPSLPVAILRRLSVLEPDVLELLGLASVLGPVVEISAGGSHTCAITVERAVVCWGQDSLLVRSPGEPSPAPPDAPLGEAYAHALDADAGAPAAHYSIIAGGLPPGLALSAAGGLAGTPTEPGSLLDVRRVRRRRVEVTGLARPALAGRRVTVRALVGRRKLGRRARATVAPDGSFRARLRLPVRRHRARVRYRAAIDGDRSAALRLARRLTIRSLRATAAGTRVRGRLAGRRRTVTVSRRVSCTELRTVATVRTNRRGRFAVTLPAPTPPDAVAYYRLLAGGHRLDVVVAR